MVIWGFIIMIAFCERLEKDNSVNYANLVECTCQKKKTKKEKEKKVS